MYLILSEHMCGLCLLVKIVLYEYLIIPCVMCYDSFLIAFLLALRISQKKIIFFAVLN
jgi:hypothetical protein